ncbi:hypothetical protein [Chitinophaga sp. OAE865]|uniref:hypothetical protein n=1 Tax=Chitinophaga sp. OAE865 TaxID=2817898 RepID=UPI001AEAEB4C
MESLLAVLKRITPYGSERGFIELCWCQLSKVISSKEADAWPSDKRDHFMSLTNFFIATARAVFTVRDALIKAEAEDLNEVLRIQLAESLDDLAEFASVVDQNELNETIDEYVEILVDQQECFLNTVGVEFGAGYFRTFFLAVYDLDIETRIYLATQFSNNKTLIYG